MSNDFVWNSPRLYGAYDTFGSLNLTVSSPPQSWTEPLDIEEMKEFLKLPVRSPAIESEDDLLSMQISAARIFAEGKQRRPLIQKQWDLSMDYFNSYRIALAPHLASVDLVKYRDSNGNYTTLVEDTDYIVDKAKHPGIIQPAFNTVWPASTLWPSSAVLIRFTAGLAADDPWWSESGNLVKSGMKELISQWWNNTLPFEVGMTPTSISPYFDYKFSFGALEHVG